MLVADPKFTKEIGEDAGSLCQEILPRLMTGLLDADRYGEKGQVARDWLVQGAIERIRLGAEDFLAASSSQEDGGWDGDFGALLEGFSGHGTASVDRPSEQRFLAFITAVSSEMDEAPVLGIVEFGVDRDGTVRLVGLTHHGDGPGSDSFASALEEALLLDDDHGDGRKVARILDLPEVYLSFLYVEDLEGEGYRMYKIDRCCDGLREPQSVDPEAAQEAVLRVLQLR